MSVEWNGEEEAAVEEEEEEDEDEDEDEDGDGDEEEALPPPLLDFGSANWTSLLI